MIAHTEGLDSLHESILFCIAYWKNPKNYRLHASFAKKIPSLQNLLDWTQSCKFHSKSVGSTKYIGNVLTSKTLCNDSGWCIVGIVKVASDGS
jgi:hypothetical protein